MFIFKRTIALMCFYSLVQAQEPSQQTSITGDVVSVTRSTLLIRSDGRYRLFSIERDTTKPANIPVDSEVQVTSYPSGDPSYRRAYVIRVTREGPAAGAAPTEPDVVPPEVRSAEDAIKRGTRKYHIGFRGGLALDPELIAIGVHAQFGPFFSKNLAFRPNVEFDWGEVTYMFAINPEVVYSVPISSARGRWDMYFGGGPGFNFVARDLSRPTGAGNVGFSDFHFDTALNVLMGLKYRSGVFTEFKTSIYAQPAPVFRLLVGYDF